MCRGRPYCTYITLYVRAVFYKYCTGITTVPLTTILTPVKKKEGMNETACMIHSYSYMINNNRKDTVRTFTRARKIRLQITTLIHSESKNIGHRSIDIALYLLVRTALLSALVDTSLVFCLGHNTNKQTKTNKKETNQPTTNQKQTQTHADSDINETKHSHFLFFARSFFRSFFLSFFLSHT